MPLAQATIWNSCHDERRSSVDHIPFLIASRTRPLEVLRRHVARANPIGRATPVDAAAVAIFQGPDHDITPSWYAKKKEGKVVLTWTMSRSTHTDRPRFMDDEQWLR